MNTEIAASERGRSDADNSILSAAKDSAHGRRLAAMIRGDVMVGDFQDTLVGLVRELGLAAARPSGDDVATAREIALDKFGDAYTNDILVSRIATALTTNRNALIETIEAKRDEWHAEIDSQQPCIGRHFTNYEPDAELETKVAAANEILSALRKG